MVASETTVAFLLAGSYPLQLVAAFNKYNTSESAAIRRVACRTPKYVSDPSVVLLTVVDRTENSDVTNSLDETVS